VHLRFHTVLSCHKQKAFASCIRVHVFTAFLSLHATTARSNFPGGKLISARDGTIRSESHTLHTGGMQETADGHKEAKDPCVKQRVQVLSPLSR
jgi:hypothetical protein